MTEGASVGMLKVYGASSLMGSKVERWGKRGSRALKRCFYTGRLKVGEVKTTDWVDIFEVAEGIEWRKSGK